MKVTNTGTGDPTTKLPGRQKVGKQWPGTSQKAKHSALPSQHLGSIAESDGVPSPKSYSHARYFDHHVPILNDGGTSQAGSEPTKL